MENKKNTITIVKPENNAMHDWYPGQTSPQPAYIELDPSDGTLRADYSGLIGFAVPAAVWHGHVRRYPCDALKDQAAYELMQSIAPLAQRVVDGFAVEWDGSNWIGTLTDDAADAEEEIEREIESIDIETAGLTVIDAGDWWDIAIHLVDGVYHIDDIGVITPDTTDAELDAYATRMTDAANDEGVILAPSDSSDLVYNLRSELGE